MIQASKQHWSFLGQVMVALNEQFHHKGITTQRPGLRVSGYGLQRDGESAQSEKSVDGKRIRKPEARNQGYLGNQCVEERNPAGGSGSTDTPIRQYVWGTYPGAAALTRPLASTGFRQQNTGLGSLNIDECIQLTTLIPLGPQSLSPGTYYLLQDLLYRAVALTNSSGAVVEAYDCDAYGNTLIFTGPGTDGIWFTDDDVQSSYGANDIIYCGYPDNKRVSTDIGTGLNDPETELYHVRNRTYSPVLGRWLQRDPIGYVDGASLYEYVGGRAEADTDPDGKAPGGTAGVPPAQPNWLPYVHTCQTATAGYEKQCNAQSRGCKGPVSPWPCCARIVSLLICFYIREQAGNIPHVSPVVLKTITINGIQFPGDPCFLGCLNHCLFQHWSAQPTSPRWKPSHASCGKCGNCSTKCCQNSVTSEQTQLSACAAGCGNHCGTPKAAVMKLIQEQAQRIKLGVGLCCGH